MQLDYYSIGGTVTGFNGNGLTLRNNGKDSLVVTSNQFTFKAKQQPNTKYEVSITQQPSSPTQTCSVRQAGSGKVPNGAVTNIIIGCVNHYTIGGTVVGLQGNASLILQNNAGDDLTVSKNGNFSFDTAIADGTIYDVAVLSLTQASNLAIAKMQSCTINDDINKKPVEGANVNSVNIVCSTNQYSVGGTVSGLLGSGFLLTNAGQRLQVSGSNFEFPPQADGSNYFVSIDNQPAGQICQIETDSSGKLNGKSISDTLVSCENKPLNFTATVGALKQLDFTWTSLPGIDFYQILENRNGISGYQLVPEIGDITDNRYQHEIAIHTLDIINGSYRLEAFDLQGTLPALISSTDLSITGPLNQAIGYFKADNPQQGDRFGTSVSLSADGDTLAVGAPGNSDLISGLDGTVYVFSQNNYGWSQSIAFKSPGAAIADTYNGANFGYDISLSANGYTLAVGAPSESSASNGINGTQLHDCNPSVLLNCAPKAGAVYLYSRNIGTGIWNIEPVYIKAPNTDTNDLFGASVSLSTDGNILAVSAPLEDSAATGVNNIAPGLDNNTSTNSGAVYIYSRDVQTQTWSPTPVYVKAVNTSVGSNFGSNIDLSADGSTLSVGANAESSGNNGESNGAQPDDCVNYSVGNSKNCVLRSGAVTVYSRNSAIEGWSTIDYFKAPTIVESEYYGTSVALSADGNTLLVGTGGDSRGPTHTVYIYSRNTEVWGTPHSLKNQGDDGYGRAISLSADGNTFVVGASRENSDAVGVTNPRINSDGNPATDTGAINSGAVYVFTRLPNTTEWSKNYVKAGNPIAANYFGGSVSISANGDSLAVGTHGEDGTIGGINGANTQACDIPITQSNCSFDAGAVYLY